MTEHTPFELALRWIWRAEGVDAEHPADRGGKTRYGISQAAHPDIDVATLTAERAAQIYKREYWDARGCDRLPLMLGIALFDGEVNHSPRTASRFLQAALGVEADGYVGPITAACASDNPRGVLDRYLAYRGVYYGELAREDASQRVFSQGWQWRLFRLQRYLLCELECGREARSAVA